MAALHPLDVAIVVLYLAVVVVAGAVLARTASKDLESYFLGGRKLPWFALGLSNASGMFDATGTMAMVAWFYVYGVKSLWIPWLWPTFNQVALMVFLAAYLRRSGAITGADWLRTRFGSGRGLEAAHVTVVAFALVAVVAFIAYAFVGVGKFASLLLPWGWEDHQYALLFMTVTTTYVMLGGMHSVVLTDVLQFGLLGVASVGVAWIAVCETSAEAIAAATPTGWDGLRFGWRLDLDWTGRVDQLNDVIANDIYVLFTPFVLMAFFNGVLKSMAGPTPGYDMQRVLAAKDERDAALMSGVVSPVLFVPRYLLITGIAVLAVVHCTDKLQAMGAEADFEKLLPLVMADFVPVGLTGLLLAGLLAAFMSTFDSNLNAGGAYLVNDLYRRYFRPDASHRELTVASYASCLLLVAAGLTLGARGGTINGSVQWIAGALFGGYAVPNALKWVWWRLNATGYVAGMAAGLVAALALPHLDLFALVPTLVVISGVASVLASLATPPDDEEVLCDFYRRVRPWGFWGPIVDRLTTEQADFQPNREFGRDMLNCGVGIVWQLALCAAPVYFVLQNWVAATTATAIAIATSAVLKVTWYDHLPARVAESTA